MHDMSKGSASPLVYLLTGYVENNKPIGKLTPVANRVVIAEQPNRDASLKHWLIVPVALAHKVMLGRLYTKITSTTV